MATPPDSLAALADSLRQLVASNGAALAAARDSLADPAKHLPKVFDVRVQDSLGAKDALSWLVQLGVALGAAIIGARIGGKTAKDAAIEAVGVEWQRERDHARQRLLTRVKSNLRRVQLLAERCTDYKQDKPLDLSVGEELEVVWNLYYRVAEPIFSIGEGDLSERLDAFFVRTHTLAETIKSLETTALDVTTVGHETEKYRDTAKVRNELPARRRGVLVQIKEIGSDAGLLLLALRSAEATGVVR